MQRQQHECAPDADRFAAKVPDRDIGTELGCQRLPGSKTNQNPRNRENEPYQRRNPCASWHSYLPACWRFASQTVRLLLPVAAAARTATAVAAAARTATAAAARNTKDI